MKTCIFLISLVFTNFCFAFVTCDQQTLDSNLPRYDFKHTANQALSWFKYHHSASDVITVTKKNVNINAQFSYGPMHQDLEDEEVEIWLDLCEDKLAYLGTFTTTSEGRILASILTEDIEQTGAYQVWMRVRGDETYTKFMLRVLNPETKLVIFDIDSTLTISEVNFVPRRSAAEITNFFKKSEYEIVYLSGRHYFLSNFTRQFLNKHQFASGSLIVGQSITDIVPLDSYVGEFKSNYLNYLSSLGLNLERAYGNSSSDIYAYQSVKIPNEHIFIMGSNGGKKGTMALGEDFTEHLLELIQD